MGNHCCNTNNIDKEKDAQRNFEKPVIREKPPSMMNSSVVIPGDNLVWENDPTRDTLFPPEYMPERLSIANTEVLEDIVPHQSLTINQNLLPLVQRHPIKQSIGYTSNMFQCLSKLDDSNPFRYYGQVVSQKANGFGQMYILQTKELWVGNFVQNLPHGICQAYLNSGDYFCGQVSKGQFVSGRMIYANGEEYTGDFKHNKRIGDGCLTCPDGSVFFGKFVDDKLLGQVKIIGANGKISYKTIKATN